MSDLEVFALSLTSEFMSIDIENSIFKQIDDYVVPNLIERSQFNKKKKKKIVPSLRRSMHKTGITFFEFVYFFIVDSMPMEICKFSRHNKIKICKDDFESAP